MSLDSPVVVVFSIVANLACSMEAIYWYGNLKQVLAGTWHKLLICGNDSFSSSVVSDTAYMK